MWAIPSPCWKWAKSRQRPARSALRSLHPKSGERRTSHPPSRRKKSAHRVLLPTGIAHDTRDGGPARPAQQPRHPRLLGIRSLGLMANRLFRAGFAYRTPPNSSRRLALGHFKAPLQVPAQSAPPPPKPRGGRAALAGERSEPGGLGVRVRMHCSVESGSRAETVADPNYFLACRWFESSDPP
jgi:hypothetical protein